MSSPVEHTFAAPHPVDLVVHNTSGRVTIVATATEEAHVVLAGHAAEEVSVDLDGTRLRVIAPTRRSGLFAGDRELDVRITVPTDSRVAAKTGSATLALEGRVRDTQVTSGSGNVTLAHLDAASLVETGSGAIRIGTARGPLNVRCGSGDVRVEVLGSGDEPAELTASTGSGCVRLGRLTGTATVKTGSGDVLADAVSGSIAVSTASGDLAVRAIGDGTVQYKGASGDVRVGVPAGTPVWTDITTVSGRLHSTLASAGAPEGDADRVEIRARTVSGNVELTAL